MRVARVLVGFVLICAGTLAITDTEVDDAPLWLLAVAIGIVGLGGLVSALASGRDGR